MLPDKIKELAAARKELAELEGEIAAERSRELAALPARYGFEDTGTFIEAVLKASGGTRGGGALPAHSATKSTRGRKRRTRATITDDMRAEVKKLVGEGKSGAEIAKIVGISLPSVQNIKKAFGLVKKRKR